MISLLSAPVVTAKHRAAAVIVLRYSSATGQRPAAVFIQQIVDGFLQELVAISPGLLGELRKGLGLGVVEVKRGIKTNILDPSVQGAIAAGEVMMHFTLAESVEMLHGTF